MFFRTLATAGKAAADTAKITTSQTFETLAAATEAAPKPQMPSPREFAQMAREARRPADAGPARRPGSGSKSSVGQRGRNATKKVAKQTQKTAKKVGKQATKKTKERWSGNGGKPSDELNHTRNCTCGECRIAQTAAGARRDQAGWR